jgi:hypothetical protein
MAQDPRRIFGNDTITGFLPIWQASRQKSYPDTRSNLMLEIMAD